MSHDPCSGPQILLQLRRKLAVHVGKQVHRDYGRFPKIHVKNILCAKADERFNTFAFCVRSCFLNSLRIYIDAYASCSVLLGSSNDDPAVSATQVVHYIALPRAREFQHRVDDWPGRGDVRSVNLDLLLVSAQGRNSQTTKKYQGQPGEMEHYDLFLRALQLVRVGQCSTPAVSESLDRGYSCGTAGFLCARRRRTTKPISPNPDSAKLCGSGASA